MANSKPSDASMDALLEEFKVKPPVHLRTGNLSFDLLSEGQGILMGGITLVTGQSSIGKSTNCMSIAKGLAKLGHKTIYVASEYAENLATSMGIIGNDLYEDSIKMVNTTIYDDLERMFWAFLKSDFTLMIIDSLTAFAPSDRAAGSLSIT